MFALGGDGHARRRQPREALGRRVDELLGPQRDRVVVGQGGVDLLGVDAQVALARIVVGPLEVLDEHAPMLCEREESPAGDARGAL
ncbi:MAG TPA: hypothetical protein VFY32_02060 [Solirubrobacteraceae bacterium]|nr:hypothetical protein [Solirubrobacteraceae bacterium]